MFFCGFENRQKIKKDAGILRLCINTCGAENPIVLSGNAFFHFAQVNAHVRAVVGANAILNK